MRTIEEIKEVIEEEGIGYAISDCINAQEVPDKELRELWKTAQVAIEGIQYMLDEEKMF